MRSSRGMNEAPITASRPVRILLKVLYWLAVLAVSIGILIGLILFLESRDSSQVGRGKGSGVVRPLVR